jgi:Na+/H+ antiporter NhaC
MNIEIKNQASTHRGVILVIGAVISLIFEWFGHSSVNIMPIFMGIAGAHALFVDDGTVLPK